jgi:tetratricopeptide (TPR) repeat protein
MDLRGLFGRLLGNLAGSSPKLYPGLDPLRLERFLTHEKYLHIQMFDNVYILPFVSRRSEPKQIRFGTGLARFMIRNLMLLRDVSIHGPEDTPESPNESIRERTDAQPHSSHITGVADFGAEGYSLRAELHRAGRSATSATVRQRDFKKFLLECSRTLAELLGSELDDGILEAWEVGQPRDAQSLVELGKIRVDLADSARRDAAIRRLLEADPDFIVPLWDLDCDDRPAARKRCLEGLERDPHNAQLCFTTFILFWSSKGPQPEALQFCRKAIELSPGHGKAHMCAPHAAQRPVEMLRHSELGYRLLPGNSFAMNNYSTALMRAKAPAERRIALAEEAIAADPNDPGSYMRLIGICDELGDYRTALNAAKRLQKLFEPVVNERALYCLRQNPEQARRLDSGEYDPVAETRNLIQLLRKML